MKKWRWYIVGCIVVMAVAIVIYWKAKACETRANECISNLVMSSKAYKPNPPNEAVQSCRESQSYLCRVFSPANLPSVGLFFVGLAAVLAGLLTLGAIRRQADIADKALRLTQVADVHIQGFSFAVPQNNLTPINPQQPLQPDTRITMIVKNFGRTRAERFTNDLIMGIQGQTTQPSQPINEIAVAIGADQEFRITFGPLGSILTAGGLAAILAGTAQFKIWGSIRYRDIILGNITRIECEAIYDLASRNFLINRYEHQQENENPN